MSIVSDLSHAASALLEWASTLALNIISFFGYPGIAFLMMVESTAVPFPSEAVMPFGGFLAAQGELSFWIVVFSGTAGSLVGAWIGYAMGYYGGRPFIDHFGKFVLLDHKDLVWTENWFAKYGDKTIFIARLVPVVRQLISIPAGMAKMNFLKFSIYTTAGAFIWVTILSYAGFALGERWEELGSVTSKFSIVIIVVLVVAGGYVAWKHLRRFKDYW